MRNPNYIVLTIVVSALVGYVLCSLYTFYLGFDLLVEGELPKDYKDKLNPSLTYITSGLTGLVGGIVATAFGVTKPDSPTPIILKRFKTQTLGSYAIKSEDENTKQKIGDLYALTYVGVGISSIIIWIILNVNAMDAISNMATTFFGMAIPIVAAYLAPEN